ncbi:MAG: hypothetical protein M3N48_08300 [Verrucomicrobiota bacterium]|nr:hypothetical protein [Verrucomicrobiota bacterium]
MTLRQRSGAFGYSENETEHWFAERPLSAFAPEPRFLYPRELDMASENFSQLEIAHVLFMDIVGYSKKP